MNSAIFGLVGVMVVGVCSLVATAVYALTQAERPDNFGDHDTFQQQR